MANLFYTSFVIFSFIRQVKRLLLHTLLLICVYSAQAQKADFSFEKLFQKNPQVFDSIIAHKSDYRLQILYTRIDRDALNRAHLTTYSYDADQYYYYCASLMKLPACALTLEKLNDLTRYRVSMMDSLAIDSIQCDDLQAESMMLGSPYSCLMQYIKEMLVVSNNSAFNPVYDFLGQQYFQDRLHEIGCKSAVVSNRYAGCDTNENRVCNPVSLYDRQTHQLKYTQPCIKNERRQFYQGALSTKVGNAYLGGGGLIDRPKDFQYSNYLALSDVHKLLTKIIFPETQAPKERLRLTRNDYQYLYKCMGMFPKECAYPAFDSVSYPDHYMKYFIALDSGVYSMPVNLRVFNKVGQAYGFMTDCSYVVDTQHRVEFFLSCAMYLNADGILNDGKYEYDSIGFPFFHQLFNAVYAEEMQRPKKILPKFQLPNFTDTLLLKPAGKPAWLRIDTSQAAAQIETRLCQLADSMWADRKLYINYDNPTADEIFLKNMELALRQKQLAGWDLESLKSKHITVLHSSDKRLSLYSWVDDKGNTTIAVIQYLDSMGRVHSLIKNDLEGKNRSPQTEPYTGIETLTGDKETTYLFFRNSDGVHSVEALKISGRNLAEAPIFKAEGKLDNLLLVSKIKGDEYLHYNAKRRKIDVLVHDYLSTKQKKKHVKLKFDGSIFK